MVDAKYLWDKRKRLISVCVLCLPNTHLTIKTMKRYFSVQFPCSSWKEGQGQALSGKAVTHSEIFLTVEKPEVKQEAPAMDAFEQELPDHVTEMILMPGTWIRTFQF